MRSCKYSAVLYYLLLIDVVVAPIIIQNNGACCAGITEVFVFNFILALYFISYLII